MVLKLIFVENSKLLGDYCLTITVSMLIAHLVWGSYLSALYLLPGVLGFGLSTFMSRDATSLSIKEVCIQTGMANIIFALLVALFYFEANFVRLLPYTLAILIPIQLMFIAAVKIKFSNDTQKKQQK